MSSIIPVYEIKVELKSEKPIRWHSWKDGIEYAKKRIMLHIERRTQKQAKREAEKYGRVLSCNQIGVADVLEREANRMESLPLDNHVYVNTNPFVSAIAMDEMIWKKKKFRKKNVRRDKNRSDDY